MVMLISVIILTALTSSFSPLLSSLQSYPKPFYVFAQIQENAALSLSNLIKQGASYQGSTSAPVTLIDFSDLQCHLCNRFVKATEPQINSTYVQTGKVAFVYLHLPNRGFDSYPAALAAVYTSDQGKFWQYHNLLYQNQGPIDSGWANKDNLKKFASQIPGIDIQRFNSWIDSRKYASFVENDIGLADSLGIHATPSFVIFKGDGSNLDTLSGAYPFPSSQTLIDEKIDGG
jgi:protein-disulfide isomerase